MPSVDPSTRSTMVRHTRTISICGWERGMTACRGRMNCDPGQFPELQQPRVEDQGGSRESKMQCFKHTLFISGYGSTELYLYIHE